MHDEQSQDDNRIDPALAAFERQLTDALAPSGLRIDRDRLMFEAGRAAAMASQAGSKERVFDRRNRFWPVATCTMTAAALLLATMLVWQNLTPPRKPSDTVIASTAKSESPFTSTSATAVEVDAKWSRSAYLPSPDSGFPAIRYIALTRGLAALDDARYSQSSRSLPSTREKAKPATARELLDELVPNSATPNRPNS